jgi:Tol biopolymer transport system component
VPPRRLGDFEILREISRGRRGIVYEAIQLSLERRVALKVLPAELTADPEKLRRFEREARVLGSLVHPNIVTVHTVEAVDQFHFITMELVEGHPLAERIPENGVSPESFVEWAIQLADACRAAHELGITHGDLRPGNIVLTENDRVKVLDFGLATLRGGLEESESSYASTLSIDLAGKDELPETRLYIAPEQLRGGHVDHRSDLFSLGVILYEMATGRRPSREESDRDATPAPVTGFNPDYSAEVDEIIGDCLRREPKHRFQSAVELMDDLEALKRKWLASARGSPTDSGDQVAPERSRSRWRRLAAWGLPLLLLLSLPVLVRWLSNNGDADLPEWTSSRLTVDPGWESEPALSPDGREVAFAADRTGDPEIWLVDAEGGTPRRLTEDTATDRSPAWFPGGRSLAFVSDRGGRESIWRLDRTGGPPVLLILDGIDPQPSPDGRQIAFARADGSGKMRIAVAPIVDPSKARLLTDANDGLWDHGAPAWSPDGETICYADFRDLWLVPSTGGPSRKLTTAHGSDSDPVWSADGSYIYFSSLREGTTALWRVPSRGGVATRLTVGTGPEVQPSLSSDGRRVVFSTFGENRDIWLLDLRTGRRSVVPGMRNESSPTFAPDLDRIVFSSNRQGTYDLWGQRLLNGEFVGPPTRLTDQRGNEALPAVSPDGRWIAYGRVLDQQRDVWVTPAAGGLPARVTNDPAVDLHPSWSPDGSRLVFASNRTGSYDLWTIRMSGGTAENEPVQLTFGEARELFPRWSPDGTRIAYIVVEAQVDSEVWVVGPDGAPPPRRVTQGSHALQVRWDRASGSLLVSGTWGSESVRILRVSVDSGVSTPLEREAALGLAGVAGLFDVSSDGRYVAYLREDPTGDLWVLEAAKGSF